MPDVSEPPPAAPAQTEPPTPPEAAKPAAPRHHERVVVIPTRGYWFAILLSLACIALAASFSNDGLNLVALVFYWATIVVALFVITWSVIGLMRRGRVIHRTLAGTKQFATGVAEGVRARGDANEGAMGRFAAKWAARFARLGRLVIQLVKIPWRIGVWAWYTGEKLFWWILNILYDILYYPLYGAWLLAHWAIRTALRIVRFALRIVWKILRLPLRLPGIRTWWRRSMRPKILARIDAIAAHHKHRIEKRIEKGRRLAQLRGENPNRWQADHEQRRGFPLPHPEKGRVYIRKRVAHIREVQRARKEGRPIPRKKRFRPEKAPAPKEGEAEPSGESADKDRKKRLGNLLKGRKSDAPEPSGGGPTEPRAAPTDA